MKRLSLSALLLASLVAFAAADEPAKAYRNVTGEKLEAVLKGLKIDFAKSAGKIMDPQGPAPAAT